LPEPEKTFEFFKRSARPENEKGLHPGMKAFFGVREADYFLR
jgi:hypothetical protein